MNGYKFDPDHPHDLNESALRPRKVSMVPLEVPIRIKRGDQYVNIYLHDATDEDLATMAALAGSDAVVGWRWARSLARRLAGMDPVNK